MTRCRSTPPSLIPSAYGVITAVWCLNGARKGAFAQNSPLVPSGRFGRSGECGRFPERRIAALPGRHITDGQKRIFMIEKNTDTIEVAAAKAGFSRVTGYRLAVDSAPPLQEKEF